MDNQNWGPSPAPHGEGGGAGAPGPVPGGVGGRDAHAPATDAVDCRSELSAESRDKIVSEIMETLKKHLPVSGPVGYSECKKIAVRFVEKIYRVASSESDYLRKISMKMLTMETKSQNTIPNAMPSNSNVIINKPSDSVSVDTGQAGNANGGDWREETYQKMQVMKENYIPGLNEIYQKVMLKLQQYESLSKHAEPGQIDKLKLFKTMLERIITFLRVPKSEISPTFKDKLGSYEKQILGVLTTHRPRKPASGQLPPHHMQSVQQQRSLPQIAKMQSHENQMNPQLPPMNIQGTVATMQQNNVSNLQHNSLSSMSGVSGAQLNVTNSLQANAAMEPGQGTVMGSLTQVALGSMPQNPVSAPHQVNMGTISHQSGVNMLQSNVSALQQNSNMIQHQHLKQEQDQQMIQTQQIHQRHMHQQHLLLHQQQLQQQAKQQQLPAQLQAHQMGQLHQISDGNDIKMRPGMGVKQGVFPQANQCPNYAHQWLKQGTSFPSSSPQLLQTVSLQIPQHSSPQIDQQSMLSSLTKAGTPLQSANSPLVVPSPSTPLASPPTPGDLEQPNPAISSLSNVGNVCQQATSAPSLIGAPSLAISTPGISASPLLAEFSYPDGVLGNIQRRGLDGGSMLGSGGVFGRYLEKQQPAEPPKNNEEIDLSQALVGFWMVLLFVLLFMNSSLCVLLSRNIGVLLYIKNVEECSSVQQFLKKIRDLRPNLSKFAK